MTKETYKERLNGVMAERGITPKARSYKNNLDRLMKDKGISRALLSVACDTHFNTINSWCNNITQPRADDLAVIFEILNITELSEFIQKDE